MILRTAPLQRDWLIENPDDKIAAAKRPIPQEGISLRDCTCADMHFP